MSHIKIHEDAFKFLYLSNNALKKENKRLKLENKKYQLNKKDE